MLKRKHNKQSNIRSLLLSSKKYFYKVRPSLKFLTLRWNLLWNDIQRVVETISLINTSQRRDRPIKHLVLDRDQKGSYSFFKALLVLLYSLQGTGRDPVVSSVFWFFTNFVRLRYTQEMLKVHINLHLDTFPSLFY